MSRLRFWILNLTSLLLVGLLWGSFFLNRHNERMRVDIGALESKVQQSRQLEPILDQLAKRVARGSETDPDLRALLTKYGMQVTLEVDGKQKTYP
jgi:hypothetical protein